MDEKYNELNEFLDKCINDALQETTDKFQVGIDHSGEIDYEQYKNPDRFTGFDEDKIDAEGEKMKDYERPPPYKIYRRPLTAEETRSYKQYEAEMDKMGPLKPGQVRPPWKGYDDSVQSYDITDEYSKNTKKRSTSASDESNITDKTYSKREQKQDPVKDIYKSSAKSESNVYPKLDWSSEKPKLDWSTKYSYDWSYPPKISSREESQENVYKNVAKPKPSPVGPEDVKSPYEERQTYKQKHSDVEKAQPTQDYEETGRPRRHSDPATSYQPDSRSRSDSFRSEGKYQTYEDFYKSVGKPEIKIENRKENNRPEPSQDGPIETKPEEKKKDKKLPGMNSEEVKEELLKLRPLIIDRASWGALPPMKSMTLMKPPADTVVFTFNTSTKACHSEDECRRTIREIQARHMGNGLADIQYNFLVGGDGNLYEGRGWAYESGIKKEKGQGKNYNIAFIGNYQGDVEKIPPHMLGPAQELLVWGNAIRLLTKDTNSAGEYRIKNKDIEDNLPTNRKI